MCREHLLLMRLFNLANRFSSSVSYRKISGDVLKRELFVQHLQKCGHCLKGLEMCVKSCRGVVRTGDRKERTGIRNTRL